MMDPVGPGGAPVAAGRDLLVRLDRREPGGVVAPAWAVVSLSVVDMIILVQRYGARTIYRLCVSRYAGWSTGVPTV